MMFSATQLTKQVLSCLSHHVPVKQARFCSSKLPTYEQKLIDSQPTYRSPLYIEFFGVLHRTNLTVKEVEDWIYKRRMKKHRESHKFLAERHKILGPDLATTHFIAFRGGKIRFLGNKEWKTKKDIESGEIPDKFSPHFYVEAVDASETLLCYESFANFIHLRCIKELYLKNCSLVDDFCLQRLYVMAPTLQHLDISGCVNVTERGICTLHRLRKLKKLIIHNTPKIAHRELTCLMLQDVLPKCEIEGVDYHNPALLRRLKNYFNEESDKLLEKGEKPNKLLEKDVELEMLRK